MNSKIKRPRPFRSVAFLLCLALVAAAISGYFLRRSSFAFAEISSASSSSQSIISSTSSVSARPGGGWLGGSEPLPLPFSSAIISQVAVDTPSCDALQFEVKRHEMLIHQYTAHADTILYLIIRNQRLIQGGCTARSRLWFFQPHTKALNALGRYETTVSVLEGVSLDAHLSDRKARALLKLGRYEEAEPYFVQADSLNSGIDPGTLAIMQVNHAWNLSYLNRYREARSLLHKAEPVLMAACCLSYIVTSITQLDSLRGHMAGKGLIPPKKTGENSDGHSEIDLMMFVYLAGTLALAWIFGRVLIPRWLHLYRETSVRPSKDGHAKSDTNHQ